MVEKIVTETNVGSCALVSLVSGWVGGGGDKGVEGTRGDESDAWTVSWSH